ncbi:MAG: hypothetical protein ABI619_11100 [Betaproteobacteria bacterium]
MLDWLFGSRGAEVGNRASTSTDSDSLLKQATVQKRGGDIEAAIRTLRLAYKQIARGITTYSVGTFLRLPLYLQEAGRNDEAWAEFNRLIIEGYPNQLRDFSVQTMEHSKIYDKMRLFLHREGKNDEAIVFGVLSMLAWARGLHLQKRKGELAKLVSRNCIEATLKPLLKKAKKTARSDELVVLIVHEVRDHSHLDLSGAAKRIRELIGKTASG